MPTLLIRHPDGNESEQELTGELTLGRAEGNDVILAEGGVSRRHARVYVNGSQVLVEDTGSANGTYVDGVKIEQPTQLGPRSQLVIGDYEISLRAAAGSPRPAQPQRKPVNGSAGSGPGRATVARPAVKAARSTKVVPPIKDRPAGAPGAALARRPARAAGVPAPATPALRGLTGPWANKLFPIRGKVTVGRVAGVQVQIEDDSVSRRHAEIEATSGGLLVRDLGSANGTLVNGAPVEGDVPLVSGDIIQFGVVELTVEGPADEAPARRRRGAESGGGGKKKLFVVLGALVGVVGLAAGAKVALSKPDVPAIKQSGKTTEDDQLQEFLSQCRSHSQPELAEPDWKRAEVACNEVLKIDPINTEANQLIKKIQKEKIAAEHYDKGERASHRLREDDAIDEFSQIPKDSFYYAKVKTQIQEVVESGMKRSGDDCKKYAANGFWSEAADRCARYMFLACQNMALSDLNPPPGFTVKPPNNPKKKQWWPADPMYRDLLTAQSHDAQAKPWHCQYREILKNDKGPPPAEEEVRRAIEQRFTDRSVAGAVMNYWYGKTNEAVSVLQRIVDDGEKAQIHAQAKQLKKEIFEATGLYTDGLTALQQNRVDDAAKYFEEALQIDKDIMKDEAERKPSFFRHGIQSEMASKSQESGKFYAERQDRRKACKVWKMGFSFFKGNTDLCKDVAFCSQWAASALEGAQSCEDLDHVLEMAVDGDGIKDKVAQQRVTMQCPDAPK